MKQCFSRIVVHSQQSRGGGSLLERFGYHYSDVLAVMLDAVVLQWWWRWCTQVPCWSLSQLSGILMGDHSEHTWSGRSRCCVHATDGPSSYCALNKNGIRQIWEIEIRRILRGTSHFEWTINAIYSWTDERVRLCCCHASASDMVTRARMMVRLASSTLKALSRMGVASTSAASAAVRNIFTSGRVPSRISSAVYGRQGTVATPPKPRRTSRITSFSITMATAAEASANS